MLDILRYELARKGVAVHTGEAVRAFSFDKGKEKFLIRHQGKDLC